MNRRDYFAAAALQGLLAASAHDHHIRYASHSERDALAASARAYADALGRELDKVSPALADREEVRPPGHSNAAGAGGVRSEGGAHGEVTTDTSGKEGSAVSHGGAPAPCPNCDGCGQVANTDAEEPWTAWAELQAPADIDVLTGLVKPITCPTCEGRKTVL